MSGLDLLVVAVTHDSAADVDGFLASLPAGLAGVNSRVVIVDSGSTDGTVAALERAAPPLAPDLVFSVARNIGYGAGVNLGVSAGLQSFGRPKGTLVLNPDLRLLPGCARVLHAALGPRVGVVAPRLVDEHGTVQRSLRRDPSVGRRVSEALLGASGPARRLSLGEVVHQSRAYRDAGPADWASGAALLLAQDCLDEVGPWDESLFLYSEEVDFVRRARQRGWRCQFEPAAEAMHRGGDAHVSPALWALLVANRVREFTRHSSPGAARLFWSASVVEQILRLPLRRRTHRLALRVLMRGRRRLLADRMPAEQPWAA